MDYSKLCSYSCCMDGEKLWQYTILGDLLEFDLQTKKIRLIKGTEKYREIPSVFTMYKMNNAFYHIENDVNAIMDEKGNPIIVLKESGNKISFFYCSQKYNNLIYLLEGNGRFYKKINIIEKNYEYEKIIEPIIYACLLPDEIIWVTSNGNVVSYSYVNDYTKTVFKSELMLDIIAATSDMKGIYYFLNKQGNIFSYDHNGKRMIWQFDLQEKGDAYSQIHFFNDKIILLPRKYSDQVKIIDKHTNTVLDNIEYPKDAIYFIEQPIMFDRYAEDKDYIIYPPRGLNYYLMINKHSGKVEWIKPINVSEVIINVLEKIKKFRNIINEGTISLEEFVDGV